MLQVWILITKNGKTSHTFCSLIYIKDVPHAVLEWFDPPSGESVPAVSVALDSSFLEPMRGSQAKFLYQRPISWPDKAD
jgi:hypothetical protein